MPLEATLVCLPLSRKEDEVVELSSPAEDGNILQGLLEDDIDATMHLVGICDPPEIEPVGVKLSPLVRLLVAPNRLSVTYLVVSHHDKTMREIASKTSIFHLIQLVLHALISSNSDSSGRPPLGHSRGKYSK
jgi:hypothetical protein